MKYIKGLIKSEGTPSIVLDLLFIMYILFDIETPTALAKLVDTPVGNIMTVLFAVSMFAVSGPIAGVLALLAAYTMITRSSRATGSVFKQLEHEAEEIKMQMFNQYNSNPTTLEEDVITDMSPIIRDDGGMNADFKPVLGNLNNASPIDYAETLT